jgi:ankyrin repeat protein
MKSVILAFVLGVCLTTWRAHLAVLLHTLYSKLHNLRQSKTVALDTHPLLLLPLMVDRAVQTEDEENAKDLVEIEPIGNETKSQPHETSSEFEKLGKELEVIQTEPETLELGDLNDLRDYLYDDNPKAAVSALSIEHVLEDSVLKSLTSVVRQLFGEQVPQICIHDTSTHSAGEKMSDAEDDFNKMEKLLRYLTCRYAVIQDNVEMIRTYMRGVAHEDYFGLFKLAVDKDLPMAFKALLQYVRYKDICSKLPVIFEYAALRGSLAIMTELHEVEFPLEVDLDPKFEFKIDVNGDDSTHPLSAAVAGGSIDAVKLLLKWGANLKANGQESIVKEYAQTPIVIAAHRQQITMVKYLISAGALAKESEWRHDALSIALVNRHTTMLLCLMRSGITFTRSYPPLERGLEIAVEHRNTELAKLLFEAGADPNAQETSVASEWSVTKGYKDTTAYGTLFQWACATDDENMVRLFLEHGVDFGKPVNSWANWTYNTPINVAWSLKHFNVVHTILDFYEDEALGKFTCYLVQNGYSGLFKHCSKYESIKNRSSWLLEVCLTRLHEVSKEGVFRVEKGKAYARIIQRLIEMGARRPSDTTWHFSDIMVVWIGYASLDELLVACPT